MINKQPLSNLQREILEIAGAQPYVGYLDVLLRVYGFVPSCQGKLKFTHHRALQSEIRSARVAICKSFNRLVSRGLVRRVHCENQIWHSITLVKQSG
jgi:hypothetical protein